MPLWMHLVHALVDKRKTIYDFSRCFTITVVYNSHSCDVWKTEVFCPQRSTNSLLTIVFGKILWPLQEMSQYTCIMSLVVHVQIYTVVLQKHVLLQHVKYFTTDILYCIGGFVLSWRKERLFPQEKQSLWPTSLKKKNMSGNSLPDMTGVQKALCLQNIKNKNPVKHSQFT